jgi:hypothetical protein
MSADIERLEEQKLNLETHTSALHMLNRQSLKDKMTTEFDLTQYSELKARLTYGLSITNGDEDLVIYNMKKVFHEKGTRRLPRQNLHAGATYKST